MAALSTIMRCRQRLCEHGQKLYVDRRIISARVTSSHGFRDVAKRLDTDKQRALLLWLDREGPHWDTEPNHSPNSYFASYIDGREEVVTESSVAETAYLNSVAIPSSLISASPSKWCFDPVVVSLLDDQGVTSYSVQTPNFWHPDEVALSLKEATKSPASWQEFEQLTVLQFSHLRFASDWLDRANSKPFDKAVMSASLRLLSILNELRLLIDERGRSDAKTLDHIALHFRNSGSLFSDSSESEKNRFASRLTFANPDDSGGVLSCSWHGKIRRLTWRLHFSAPFTHDSPLYVVYLGPKLTSS